MKNQMYTMEASCKDIHGITRKYVVIATEEAHSEMKKCWNHFVDFNCDPARMHYYGVVILEEEVYNKTFKDLFKEVKEMNKVYSANQKEILQARINEKINKITQSDSKWNWILTDDDDFQWFQRVDKDSFIFMQRSYDERKEAYVWVKTTIYLHSDWLDNGEDMLTETVNILGQYGFTSQFALFDFDYDESEFNKAVIDNMKEEFPEDWERIIAECIFESEVFDCDWKEYYDTDEECKLAMLDWMETHP